MRLLIVSDTWHPQLNDVVRINATLKDTLERLGHACFLLTPGQFRIVSCPSYLEIRLALTRAGAIEHAIEKIALHIAMEGSLGLNARCACLTRFMVATRSMTQRLSDRGFQRLAFWSRGADLDLFKPRDGSFLSYPCPVSLYVGRVAIERTSRISFVCPFPAPSW